MSKYRALLAGALASTHVLSRLFLLPCIRYSFVTASLRVGARHRLAYLTVAVKVIEAAILR